MEGGDNSLSTFARSIIDNCRINGYGLYEGHVTEILICGREPLPGVVSHHAFKMHARKLRDNGARFGI
jgi:hypothetical protein